MQVLIVGSGKLATELLDELSLDPPFAVLPWSMAAAIASRSIVVHAGSGRELGDVMTCCGESGSPLIELATGSQAAISTQAFPIVVCPNTNILMLKFMSMLERSGAMFEGYQISVTESHQAAKRSTPGTAIAIAIAHSLGLGGEDVVSVRDPEVQQAKLRIPPEHLGRHAAHFISIQDGVCSISIDTRVYGAAPYAPGVARIVAAVGAQPLENRVYAINEFIENGWV